MGDEPLPELLQEIADVIGRDGALAFAAAFGGTEFVFPTEVASAQGRRIAGTIGEADAAKLIEHFTVTGASGRLLSAGKLTVPMGPEGAHRQRLAVAREALRNGASAQQVASLCGVHVRTAYRLKSKLRAERATEGKLP